VDLIAQSTARFIANRASLKLKHAPLMDMIRRLRKAVAASQKAPSTPSGKLGSKRASTSAKDRA
jgi:ATP phosphoribosyltransferase